jgi:hypothetical protein
MEERRSGMFVGGRLKGSMIEAAVRRFSKPRVGGAPADPNPARPRLIRYFNYRPLPEGKKRPGAAQPIRVVHIW